LTVPGDSWLECSCGRRHWGRFGAAGLLLTRDVEVPDDAVTDGALREGVRRQVLLQHRALWSDQGGTWGVPGGALHEGEDPVSGALREAAEEAGIDPTGVQVLSTHLLDHGPWRYTTVLGRVSGLQDPRPTDAESLEIAWVEEDAVAGLPLLIAFGTAWPTLRAALDAEDGHRDDIL
jgi:septum formation protein